MDEPPQALIDAIDAAIVPWTLRHVDRLLRAWTGAPPSAEQRQEATAAGRAARDAVHERLVALLSADIDDQRTNPLAVLRSVAVAFPTRVLRAAGVPDVVRDDFAERTFPDDVYDLSPATWRDLGDDVHDAGIVWGAWKAQQHLQRHKPRPPR